jgi:hypothetical protein
VKSGFATPSRGPLREREDMRNRRGSSAGNGGTGSLAGARKHRPDYWLVILTLGMLVIGLIVVYSISPALSKADGGAIDPLCH